MKTKHTPNFIRRGKHMRSALCLALVVIMVVGTASMAYAEPTSSGSTTGTTSGSSSSTSKPASTSGSAVTSGTTSSSSSSASSSTTSTASQFKDVGKHWAAKYIAKAVEHGFVKGYEDKTFRPDNSITRAEFVTMLNLAIGNKASESTGFKDVKSLDWYSEGVAKAVRAGYVSGYEDQTFRPENNITRQEAAIMIARIVPTYGEKSTLASYKDYKEVPTWATEGLEKICGKNYIGAYDDGKLHPGDKLTRAQAAKIIDDILDNETIYTYDKAMEIQQAGKTIKDCIIANDISIGSDVDGGAATFSNCTVLGTLKINEGGDNSSNGVLIENSKISKAEINKSTGPVRVMVAGETVIREIDAVQASDTATIVQKKLAGGTFGTGIALINIKKKADVQLEGDFEKVIVKGEKVDVKLSSSNVKEFVIEKDCPEGDITVDSGSTIQTATVDSPCEFLGKGTIELLYANVNGITCETQPTKVKTGDDVDEEITAKDVLPVAVLPANGSTKVSIDPTITLTFGEKVTDKDGDRITDSELKSIITLRENSSSGSKITITPEFDSTRTKINVNLSDSLKANTSYYLSVPAESFWSGEKKNSLLTVKFTTGSSSYKMTFTPRDGATEVTATDPLKITFSEAVVQHSSGSYISNSYLNDVVVLKKDTKSGADVSYSASISSDRKTITVYPASALSGDTTYYFGIVGSKIRYINGDASISADGVFFTVKSESIIKNSIKTSSTDSTLTVTFNSNCSGTAYFEAIEGSSVTAPTGNQIVVGKNAKGEFVDSNLKAHAEVEKEKGGTATFSGLKGNTAYTIFMVVQDTSSDIKKVYSVVASTSSVKLYDLVINAYDDKGNLIGNVVKDFKTDKTGYTCEMPAMTKSIEIIPKHDAFAGKTNIMINSRKTVQPSETVYLEGEKTDVQITLAEDGVKNPYVCKASLYRKPEVIKIECGTSTTKLEEVTTNPAGDYVYDCGTSANLYIKVSAGNFGTVDKTCKFKIVSATGRELAYGTSGTVLSKAISVGENTECTVYVYGSNDKIYNEYRLFFD